MYVQYIFTINCIVHASSNVDHWFEPQSDQTKDYKSGIWCFSGKDAALRNKCKGTSYIIISWNITCSRHDIAGTLLLWH